MTNLETKHDDGGPAFPMPPEHVTTTSKIAGDVVAEITVDSDLAKAAPEGGV